MSEMRADVRRMRDMESFTHEEVARVVPFVQKNIPQDSQSYGLVNGLTLTAASYLSLIDHLEKLKRSMLNVASEVIAEENKRRDPNLDRAVMDFARTIENFLGTLLEKA